MRADACTLKNLKSASLKVSRVAKTGHTYLNAIYLNVSKSFRQTSYECEHGPPQRLDSRTKISAKSTHNPTNTHP